MKVLFLPLVALLVAACAFPALASPVIKVAAGVNGVWLDGPAVDFAKDIEAGAVAAASLSPHLSLVGHGFYGFTQNYVRYDGEGRITASDATNPNFNLYLGMRYRNGSTAAVRPGEWAPDAGLGWRPSPTHWPHVILGADAAYGLTTQKVISYAAVRFEFGRAGR
jgi:hypothetical protein